MTSKKKSVAKAETFSNEQNQATVKKVGQWTPQSVAQKVTDATVSVNKTFSEVSSQLQGVLTEYEDANLALQAKKDELETIFSKEQVLKNLDDLNVDFEQHKISIEDQKAAIERERQQEDADFQFNTAQTRKNDQLKYEDELRVRKNYERDQTEVRQKDWALREETLKKQENELVELRAKTTAFPAELDAAVKKAEAIKEAVIKREYEHRLQLLQKDFETSKVVSDNTIKGYQERLAANDKVITELTTQLTNAQNKVGEIAKEALQSASNTKSLADVKDFMQNQGNGQPARKA